MIHRLNSRQRLFCCNLLQGLTLAQAYHAAGYKTKPPFDAAAAFRLRSNPVVAAHLAELQATQTSDFIASRDELLAFHTRVLRTAPAELDDSDPLLEVTRNVTTRPDGTVAQTTRVRSPSKLAAAREIARITGLHQRPAQNPADAPPPIDPHAEAERILRHALSNLSSGSVLPSAEDLAGI